jgi:VIT1/CCC1 family predicted Fe2+/Mn2+ transporter
LAERELRLERHEIINRPAKETAELVALYESRGVRKEVAEEVASALMADTDQALEVHAREELGVDPQNLGRPTDAAMASLAAFSAGALLPLVPWLAGSGDRGWLIVASVVLAIGGAIAVGVTLARFTGGSRQRAATRQLALGAMSAAVAYTIGHFVGTSL